MFFNFHNLCIRRDQQFVINFGFASMGHGTSAPVGAALAQPDRTVVAIVCDACFTMNGMELLTAVEYGVPVVWIVENNNMHGIIWHGSKLVGRQQPMEAVRFRRPLEVAAIGRAMGLHTWVVERPGMMQEVFTEAASLRRPCLIEVRVDGDISPPLGDRAKSIGGFSKGD
jgi:acetolactate synthase-1/2/3 large subunit